MWAGAQEKYRINMNKTSGFKVLARDARAEKTAKTEPLRLLNEFDRQFSFNRTGCRELPLAALRKRFSRAMQVQATCDLLLRSLVLRTVHNCENAG